MKMPARVADEVSAGGLVLSAERPSQVAIISHLNRGGRADWCIPKGHPEGGETLEQAAVREIYEETGLHAEIVQKIGEIHYNFKAGNRRISKTVHHFLMRQIGGTLNAGLDPTGEVIDVAWFDLGELEQVLAHENERRVAALALELLT
jgi:8-oxo-dGTP pyrophosphatase MutT (NUDIX family)